jgi:hypothetical protein
MRPFGVTVYEVGHASFIPRRLAAPSVPTTAVLERYRGAAYAVLVLRTWADDADAFSRM